MRHTQIIALWRTPKRFDAEKWQCGTGLTALCEGRYTRASNDFDNFVCKRQFRLKKQEKRKMAKEQKAVETDLRYPVGKWETKGPFTNAQRHAMIESVTATPANLRAAVSGLNDNQLNTPYRPSGWTARQVVHHVADSHM